MKTERSNVRRQSERIVAIDALRGFDMFWIIGGASFANALFRPWNAPIFRRLEGQLLHSAWNGCTFWDLIFPLFLFIVGASIPFALESRLARGESRGRVCGHVAKRVLLLFFLGLIVNGFLDLDFGRLRIAGVLQRIAICYGVCALLFLYSKLRAQAIVFAGLLLIYWGLMVFIPVPGFGAGNLTPEGNLAGYIDRVILPGTFCCYGYGDNEGILSTIPAVSTTLIGVFAAAWLRSEFSKTRKSLGLAIAGIACVLAGLLWNLGFPINKLIWSSSYVLFTGGWSLLLLAVFYGVIDGLGWKGWAFPFVVIGLNPITIYVVQAVFDFGSVAGIFLNGFVDGLGGAKPIVWSFSVLTVKWLFLYFLYRHKIFLKA